MPLADGFEFIVSDQVPQNLGVRKLNARTFEVHPQTYAILARLLDGHEEFRRTFARIGKTFKEVGLALAALAEELGLAKNPGGANGTGK